MVKMEARKSSGGAVAKTAPKAGGKGKGASQAGANKYFKNAGAAARRVAIKVAHGKSGLPSPVTAKGKGVFQVTQQPNAFTNDKGVMKGNGGTRFVC